MRGQSRPAPQWQRPTPAEAARRNRESIRRIALGCCLLGVVGFWVFAARQVLHVERRVMGEDLGAGKIEQDMRNAEVVMSMYEDDVRGWLERVEELRELHMIDPDAKRTRHQTDDHGEVSSGSDGGSTSSSAVPHPTKFRRVVEIERVPHAEMTFRRFYEEYETRQKPVVITDVPLGRDAALWTRRDIAEACGSKVFRPVVPDKPGASWGNLKSSKRISVANFLKKLEQTKGKSNLYMHDWSLPDECPALLDNYVVPAYFVQDYLGRMEVPIEDRGIEGSTWPYAKSWPSLFVGETGTGSGLHIDSSDTHFVMHMIDGTKEFRVLGAADRIVGYENRDDYTFASDLFKPDFVKHPLLALAKVYTATLGPGDLLFIPGGAAHQVRNLSPVISISTNFVDASNAARVVKAFEGRGKYHYADAMTGAMEHGTMATVMDPKPLKWADREKEWNKARGRARR